MHNKKNNNIKSQNFIQGLRPFSSSIPRGIKKILKKGGYNFSSIIDNWSKIVDQEISEICYPNSIKSSKEMSNAILNLNVIHGKELIVEYQKRNIIDRINSFFGYNFVSQIKLKIIEVESNVKKKSNSPTLQRKNFEKKLLAITNVNLKNSLNNLVDAFEKKND